MKVWIIAAMFVWLVALPAARAERVDTRTQRNGMHSCQVGEFVVGVQDGKNQLLCAAMPGDFTKEIVDKDTQVERMHACPPGMAMTGHEVAKNLLACAPLTTAQPRTADLGTQRSGMHACPPGLAMSGEHASTNVLLCGTSDALGQEAIDVGTQRNGMHSCPVGRVMVGEQVSKNYFLCDLANANYKAEIVDTGTQSHGMHACPEGDVMTGLESGVNQLSCVTLLAGQVPRRVDRGTQRDGMHACPPGLLLSGNHVHNNLLLCGSMYTVNIISFTRSPASGQLNPGQSGRLSWVYLCNDPACVVQLAGPGVPANFNAKTTPTLVVSSSVIPADGAKYTFTLAAGGATLGKTQWLNLVAPVPPPQPPLMTYYFEMTDEDSEIEPCEICSASATSEALAQAICQHDYGNYQIEQVPPSTQCPPPF